MRRARLFALVVFLVAFIIYAAPVLFDLAYKPFFGYVAGQDIVSTSVLPVRLLSHGDFYLSEYMDFFQANWRSPGFVAMVNGQVVSRYPVGTAILALPLYGLPLGLGWIDNPPVGWLFFPWSTFFIAKVAAALMTALAVSMMFFCARELTDVRTSAIAAIAFAFGTSAWSTASQGLWQQTPSLFLQTIGLWFILRGRRLGAFALAPAAFFFSAATVSRVNDAVVALVFTIYVLIFYRSGFLRWVLWAVPPGLFFLGYNFFYNGSPLVFGYQEGVLADMSVPGLDVILGLLVSPSRGLFIYSPFLLFSVWGIWLARSKPQWRFYSFAAVAFTLIFLSVSIYNWWDGAWGYGTRMLTDGLPYAILLLIPWIEQMYGVAHFAFWGMVVYAMALQSFGLWDYGVRWYWNSPNWNPSIWDVSENEPLFYMKQYLSLAQRFLRNLHP